MPNRFSYCFFLLLAVALVSCQNQPPSKQILENVPTKVETQASKVVAPKRELPVELFINGNPWGEVANVTSGDRVTLRANGVSQPICLKEKASGLVWFQGLPNEMSLGFWALKGGAQEMELVIGEGDEAKSYPFTLNIESSDFVYYPGMQVELMRLEDDEILLPESSAFKPQRVMEEKELIAEWAQAYPSFRTAESVFKPTIQDGAPTFMLPDYWRRVLANPSFSKDIAKKNASQSYLCHPLGDLVVKHFATAAKMANRLLVPNEGLYKFQVSSSMPFRFTIGQDAFEQLEKDAEGVYPLLVEVVLPSGLIPFEFITGKGVQDKKDKSISFMHVEWQVPGSSEFVALRGKDFVHAVLPEEHAVYKEWVKKQKVKSPTFKKKALSPPENAYILALKIEEVLTDWKQYKTTSDKLLKLFVKTQSLDVWKQFTLLEKARHIDLLKDSHYKLHSFAKTNGDYMKFYEDQSSFLNSLSNHPVIQSDVQEIINGRRSFAEYIWKRSYFSEVHSGTNDGYGDHHNFLVNIWRAAKIWKDPIAWNTSMYLLDNHFSYGPGGRGAMHTDGVFCFHSANGRHSNMEGYGDGWYNRVVKDLHSGSPWSYAPEQWKRLVDMGLNFEWFFYKGSKAFTTAGRHNTHKGAFQPERHLGRYKKLPEAYIDVRQKEKLQEVYERFKNKELITGNRFHFRHLQMFHRGKDFYMDVKLNSPQVGGIETFASATPGNLSFADGVTTLMRHGDEYTDLHEYNIPASLWKFRSLPGTTQLNYEYGDLSKWGGLDRYRTGEGRWAGGVSNGEYGHTGFEFISHKKNTTTARKMFTFVEDGMVVLGAGITGSKKASHSHYSYRTNVNQCVLKDVVRITNQAGKTIEIKADELGKQLKLPLDQKYWISHYGIGYLVIPTGDEMGEGISGTLNIGTELRTAYNRMAEDIWENEKMGKYKKTVQDFMASEKNREAKVLSIWIDHGEKPTNGKCAYFVSMRAEGRSAEEWIQFDGISILENTLEKQAVADRENNWIHGFCYEATDVKDSNSQVTVTVGEPASFMYSYSGAQKGDFWLQDIMANCQRRNQASTWKAQIPIKVTSDEGSFEENVWMLGGSDVDDRYRADMKYVNGRR